MPVRSSGSAFLLLLRQDWRTSINRFTEAMTLFSVSCAGMFPLLHLGRPMAGILAVALSKHDVALAAVPQPAGLGRVRGVDLRNRVAAVLVYGFDSGSGAASRSVPFQDSGKIHLRCMMALGWRGSARHWQRYNSAYILLAGLGCSAGGFGAQHRGYGLRSRTDTGLA